MKKWTNWKTTTLHIYLLDYTLHLTKDVDAVNTGTVFKLWLLLIQIINLTIQTNKKYFCKKKYFLQKYFLFFTKSSHFTGVVKNIRWGTLAAPCLPQYTLLIIAVSTSQRWEIFCGRWVHENWSTEWTPERIWIIFTP